MPPAWRFNKWHWIYRNCNLLDLKHQRWGGNPPKHHNENNPKNSRDGVPGKAEGKLSQRLTLFMCCHLNQQWITKHWLHDLSLQGILTIFLSPSQMQIRQTTRKLALRKNVIKPLASSAYNTWPVSMNFENLYLSKTTTTIFIRAQKI